MILDRAGEEGAEVARGCWNLAGGIGEPFLLVRPPCRGVGDWFSMLLVLCVGCVLSSALADKLGRRSIVEIIILDEFTFNEMTKR